ncbi:hypothetical protein CBS101457_006814 [Exobasidium rhododendri]|nr:hypothetical protein CBS101457_006814 [Exobasidium rhododendri]
MTSPIEPINVLIVGGLSHLGRPLLSYLVNLDHSSGIKYIRMVGKGLILGKSSTIYLDPDTFKALEDPRVEYRQVNLDNKATASSIFDLPDDEVFHAVFDLTGEGIIGSDVSSQLMLERTTKLAGLLASEAKKHKVRAYIRDTPCFWTCKPDEGPWKESGISTRSLPKGVRFYFFYEAERAVAAVDDLPLVLLRSAAIYGPFQHHGYINPRLALGDIYRHLQEPMKMLWSADLKVNTLHSVDWCKAAWLSAQWCMKRSRAEANKEAGEDLPKIDANGKIKNGDFNVDQDFERCCPRRDTPKAPVFNVVDDGDTDQGKLLDVVSKVFGIETGFTNMAINMWAKFNLDSVVEDMNEKHAEAMNTLLTQADPPITNSPLTCFLHPEDLAQRSISLNGAKIKKVLGWQPKESFCKATIEGIIESFKESDSWVCR